MLLGTQLASLSSRSVAYAVIGTSYLLRVVYFACADYFLTATKNSLPRAAPIAAAYFGSGYGVPLWALTKKESKMELPFTVNGIKAYYANDASFDTGKIAESDAYVLDADGWNLYLRNNISESLNNVRVEAGMPRLKAMCNLRSEKIPYALIRKVGKFFTEVYKLHKSEAVGYLYYSPTLGWLFWPPEQTTTTAHCKYGEPAAIDGYQVAGTIHSHGSMSAFHSGTDKDDEANFDGIHITIGKVDEVRYELALSVVCGGVRYKVAEEQLISGFGDTMVPSEWLEAVKQPAVV